MLRVCAKHGDIFRNSIKSDRIQIVFTIFRLIWNRTDTSICVPNHLVNGKYNLISVWFNKITGFCCTRKNLFQIFSNQTGIRLYLAFFDWLGTKRTRPLVFYIVNTIWFPFDLRRFGKDFLVCCRLVLHTEKSFQIFSNQNEIRLYLPISDWFGTKRTSVWYQINR